MCTCYECKTNVREHQQLVLASNYFHKLFADYCRIDDHDEFLRDTVERTILLSRHRILFTQRSDHMYDKINSNSINEKPELSDAELYDLFYNYSVPFNEERIRLVYRHRRWWRYFSSASVQAGGNVVKAYAEKFYEEAEQQPSNASGENFCYTRLLVQDESNDSYCIEEPVRFSVWYCRHFQEIKTDTPMCSVRRVANTLQDLASIVASRQIGKFFERGQLTTDQNNIYQLLVGQRYDNVVPEWEFDAIASSPQLSPLCDVLRVMFHRGLVEALAETLMDSSVTQNYFERINKDVTYINTTLREDGTDCDSDIHFQDDVPQSLNSNHKGVAAIITGTFVSHMLNMIDCHNDLEVFVMCRSMHDYLIVDCLLVTRLGYWRNATIDYTIFGESRPEQFIIATYNQHRYTLHQQESRIRYIVLLPNFLVSDTEMLDAGSRASDNTITLERAYLELIDTLLEYDLPICRYFILGNCVYNANMLGEFYRTQYQLSYDMSSHWSEIVIAGMRRNMLHYPNFDCYVEHNANKQLIRSTLSGLHKAKSSPVSVAPENNVFAYIAMIDQQATSKNYNSGAPSVSIHKTFWQTLGKVFWQTLRKVNNGNSLVPPEEWKCWRVRYRPANASSGRVDDELTYAYNPFSLCMESVESSDTRLSQKTYSDLRYRINNDDSGRYSAMAVRRNCLTTCRILLELSSKYEIHYTSEAIRLAHKYNITCLEELYDKILHQPRVRNVFFNALVAPSQEQQSSSSVRSMFERRFKFSVLNVLQSENNESDTTQQIKSQKETRNSVMKDNDDCESIRPTKAITILHEHTIDDYWAPDENVFKNFARLGTFVYMSSLSSSLPAMETTVRQSESLCRVRITMPSELLKKGLPVVLIS